MRRAEEKIRTEEELLAERSDWRTRVMTVVFTNGCFDLLHEGHISCLEEARRLGDVLVVAINSDRSVRALKGPGRPLFAEGVRARLVGALESVDRVTVFDDPDPGRLIGALVPDVLVKGGDYPLDQIVGRQTVEEAGGRVVSLPLVPGASTSALIKQLKQLLETH